MLDPMTKPEIAFRLGALTVEVKRLRTDLLRLDMQQDTDGKLEATIAAVTRAEFEIVNAANKLLAAWEVSNDAGT